MTTNTENIKTADAFLDWEEALGSHEGWTEDQRTQREALFKSLPPRERYLVQRDRIEAYFTEENKQGSPKEIQSPSGRYRAAFSCYGTKPGAWNYSRCEVYRVSDGATVADVKRNYSSFWHLFVEDHKVTGHDYLLCGEDYQGHTVVDLTTGEVMSHIPDDAFQGHGWCPASAELLPDGVTLKVEGCYWACPYEIRLWDFTNPLPPSEQGLTNLTDGLWLDLENDSDIRVEGDGSLVWEHHVLRFKETGEWSNEIHFRDDEVSKEMHFAHNSGDEARIEASKKAWSAAYAAHNAKYDESNPSLWERTLDHRRVFRRQGDKYVEIEAEEYKSPRLQEADARHEKREAEDKARFKEAREADPIYALVREEWPEDHLSRTSRLFPSQASRWDGEKNAFYFKIRVGAEYDPEKPKNRTAEVEWGNVEGPIKAKGWTYGKGEHTLGTYTRDEAGFKEALALARAHLEG